MKFLLCVILLACHYTESSGNSSTFKETIEAAKSKTNEILKTLFDRWEIKDYPNFLRSVAMSHTSWEVLKVT